MSLRVEKKGPLGIQDVKISPSSSSSSRMRERDDDDDIYDEYDNNNDNNNHDTSGDLDDNGHVDPRGDNEERNRRRYGNVYGPSKLRLSKSGGRGRAPEDGVIPPKLEHKRARNREAASRCRKRKLDKIAALEARVAELNQTNESLLEITSMLTSQVSHLKQQVIQHVTSGCDLSLTPLLHQPRLSPPPSASSSSSPSPSSPSRHFSSPALLQQQKQQQGVLVPKFEDPSFVNAEDAPANVSESVAFVTETIGFSSSVSQQQQQLQQQLHQLPSSPPSHDHHHRLYSLPSHLQLTAPSTSPPLPPPPPASFVVVASTTTTTTPPTMKLSPPLYVVNPTVPMMTRDSDSPEVEDVCLNLTVSSRRSPDDDEGLGLIGIQTDFGIEQDDDDDDDEAGGGGGVGRGERDHLDLGSA